MSLNDNRGTPFSENIRELWKAIKTGGRVGHELKNVAVELIREHPAKTALLILLETFLLIMCGVTGVFL